ncbi:MAG: hypothetical protein IID49_13305 [Proteobacteria bacterium]|nr:hypothetical protein [Pseudomonadota bacterium]
MRLPAAWRPLIAWAVAAVLCAPLALSMLFFHLLMDPNVALTVEQEEYLESLDRGFAAQPEDAPADANMRRGVVFATSGLACAITGPMRLPGERVEIMALSTNAASLLHFGVLIGPAIAARPDFVVVQSALLVPAEWNILPSAAAAARYFWRGQVLAMMPVLVRSDPPPGVTPVSWCPAKTMPLEQWQDALKSLAGQIMPFANRRRDRTRALLHRFAEAGIPVLVVTPPVNEFSEAYHARVNQEARSTMGPVAGAAAVSFLEPPTLWSGEQFIDPVHIKPDQAEPYRAWLSAAILTALGD